MSKTYADSRYGIEKILTFPSVTLSAAAATGGALYFTEDITIIEFGLMISTAITATGTAASLDLRKGASILATLTSATGTTALGSTLRTTTGISSTSISNADTLLVATVLTGSAGAGIPYIKYRERFVSG